MTTILSIVMNFAEVASPISAILGGIGAVLAGWAFCSGIDTKAKD